jgi:hypothetical protein
MTGKWAGQVETEGNEGIEMIEGKGEINEKLRKIWKEEAGDKGDLQGKKDGWK